MKNVWKCVAALSLLAAGSVHAEAGKGQVVDAHIMSRALEGNLVGIDRNRLVKIYLPPGYANTKKSYPVLYYFHSIGGDARQVFADGSVQGTLDRTLESGSSVPLIFVVADFSAPGVGTSFGNAKETGRWIDFIKDELVPYVDDHFRTLKVRESRGLTGEFLGGYVAIKLAMLFPETFSAVYAMHPVGTGVGLMPFETRVDWKKLNRARSWSDLEGDGYARAFMAMAQGYSPNPNRPPFYCDFMYELKGDELVFNAEHARKLQMNFLLDELLPVYAENLRKIDAIAFDWGRYDPNPDHVYGNQTFTRKLDAFGIKHTAEEYRGMFWSEDWIVHGRVEERVLPFFKRYLRTGS